MVWLSLGRYRCPDTERFSRPSHSNFFPASAQQVATGTDNVGKDIDITLGKLIFASDFWAIGVQGNIYQDHRNFSVNSSAMNRLIRHSKQDTLSFQEKQSSNSGRHWSRNSLKKGLFSAKRQIIYIWGSAGCGVLVAALQLCHYWTKSAMDNM